MDERVTELFRISEVPSSLIGPLESAQRRVEELQNAADAASKQKLISIELERVRQRCQDFSVKDACQQYLFLCLLYLSVQKAGNCSKDQMKEGNRHSWGYKSSTEFVEAAANHLGLDTKTMRQRLHAICYHVHQLSLPQPTEFIMTVKPASRAWQKLLGKDKGTSSSKQAPLGKRKRAAAIAAQEEAAVADVQRRLTAIEESQESWEQKLPETKDLMQQLQSKDQELAYAENFNYVVRDMLQQLSTVVPLLHNKLSNVMETQAEMGWFTSIMQNASQKLALLQATRQQQQQQHL